MLVSWYVLAHGGEPPPTPGCVTLGRAAGLGPDALVHVLQNSDRNINEEGNIMPEIRVVKRPH